MGVFQIFLHVWAFFPEYTGAVIPLRGVFPFRYGLFLCLDDFILPYGRA